MRAASSACARTTRTVSRDLRASDCILPPLACASGIAVSDRRVPAAQRAATGGAGTEMTGNPFVERVETVDNRLAESVENRRRRRRLVQYQLALQQRENDSVAV